MREWEARPLCLALVGYAIGLSLDAGFWVPLAVAGLLLLLARWRSRVVVAAAFLIGCLVSPDLDQPMVIDDQPYHGRADILSVPERRGDRLVAIAEVDGGRLLISVPADSGLGMGDKVEVRGQIEPLRDGASRSRGVTGVLSTVGELHSIESGSPIWQLGMRVRDGFVATTRRLLSPEAAAISDALCFNVTGGLDEEFYNDLRRTGTTHIISTSGVHVIITAGLFLFLLRQLPIPRHWQLVALVLLLLIYAGAAGFRPPIVRAVVMAAIGLSAYLFRREGDGLSAWAAAGLTFLILDPYTISDIGFLLSMAAAGGLVMGMGRYEPYEWRGLTWLWKPIQVSLVAWLATLPLVAYFFGSISLISIPANLVIELPVTVIIWCALLSWMLSGLLPWVAAGAMTQLVEAAAEFLAKSVRLLSDFDYAAINVPYFSSYWLLPIYIALLMMWRPSERKA